MTHTPYGHALNVAWEPSKMPPAISIAQSVRSTPICRTLVPISPSNACRVLLSQVLLQRVVPTPRVNVMQATMETDRLAAPLAQLANTTGRQTCKCARLVRRTRSLQREASLIQRVSATMGSREQTEPHVRSAISTITKRDWALVFARLVRPTRSLPLEASFTRRVSATPGTREQMEPHVHSAVSTITKQDRAMPLAHLVKPTHSLQLAASLTRRASATPGTREQMETHVHSA